MKTILSLIGAVIIGIIIGYIIPESLVNDCDNIFYNVNINCVIYGKGPKAEDIAGSVDEVMRKYDRESNTRIWEGAPKVIITVLIAVFSLYCIFMTLFPKADALVRLSLFLGFITLIGYITYPAHKKKVKVNSMPWYDILLMIIGSGCFFYFAANAKTIIALSTRIQPIHVVLGIIGILVVVELCRRCVGVPILCVAGAILIYTFAIGTKLKRVIFILFYGTGGIMNTPLQVCARYIAVFIIFGAFLERTGISNFFISLPPRKV